LYLEDPLIKHWQIYHRSVPGSLSRVAGGSRPLHCFLRRKKAVFGSGQIWPANLQGGGLGFSQKLNLFKCTYDLREQLLFCGLFGGGGAEDGIGAA
jgi:hypothetical protein